MKRRKRKFFDEVAQNWDNSFYKDKEINNRLNKLVLKFNIKKGDKVLDLGCGTGVISERLSELTGERGEIFCCDFSFNMLKETKKKKKGVNGSPSLICADAHRLPFKESLFDSIICFSCFPHFGDKKKFLKEAGHILKKRGSLIISHLLSSAQIAEVHRRAKGAVSKDKMPSRQEMTTSFQKAKFKIVEFLDKEGFYLLHTKKNK